SGIENHAKYGELIYAHSDDNLYVNLFIPSTLNWREKNIQLTQQTLFPDAEQSQITVQSKGRFTLNIRYPRWVAEKALTVRVNGKAVKVTAKPGDYIALKRNWRAGDQVVVNLPMTTRLESLPDQSDYYAVVHGPIVLAAKTQPFGTERLNYFSDDSRMGHIASGKICPLESAPMFVTDQQDFLRGIQPVANKPLTFSV